MTSPTELAPSLISTGAQALVTNAQRLGLTWTLRLAGISTTSPLTGIFDGDTVPVNLTNMLGTQLAIGERVYVLIVPPAGNFAIGMVENINSLVDWVASTTSTGAIGAETVVLTGNIVTFRAGRAYEVTFLGETIGSIASNTAGYIIRRTNLAGTILYTTSAHLMNVNVGFSQTCMSRTITRNATGNDVINNLVLTLQAIGGGTVTMTAAATNIRYMEIRDIGPAARYIDAIQI